MKTYRIATIPGDGIGKEVVPAGRLAMDALAAADGSFRLHFEQPQWAVTPGQSAVVYDGEVCLGGGVIAEGQPD